MKYIYTEIPSIYPFNTKMNCARNIGIMKVRLPDFWHLACANIRQPASLPRLLLVKEVSSWKNTGIAVLLSPRQSQ